VDFGKLVDKFIEDENDFLLLEYIMNALNEGASYNAYYVFKLVSIIELLIKNPNIRFWNNNDISKLAEFINYNKNDRKLSRLIIQIRNKIGHGDFKALQHKTDKYADNYMKDYYMDYYEYSKINWVFLNLSCKLNQVLSDILWGYLNYKDKMNNLKLK